MNVGRALTIHSELIKLERTIIEQLQDDNFDPLELSDKHLVHLFAPLIDFVERGGEVREKAPASKRKLSEGGPVAKRSKSVTGVKADEVAGNVISVYGATNGRAEVWYYLLEQNFDGILLDKFGPGNLFHTTATIDPIEPDTVLNWNVKAQIDKSAIYISVAEREKQEKQLRLSLGKE